MAKKGKTPAGEKCERTLPFKLNDEDKARKGEDASKYNKQLEAAVEAKKFEMSKHNAKITELTKKVSSELKKINEGIERRPVTCVAVKNFEKDVIEYWFEGEVLETTPMKPDDRQMKLVDEKAPPVPKGVKREKWQTMAPKYKPGTGEETQEEQIASIHKLETSKKGASSMVDPK